MAVIPFFPPFPPLEGVHLWASAAASLVGGAALVFWGDRIHRVALTLVGLGAGYIFGGDLAETLGIGTTVGRFAGAFTLGLLALIGARVVWAVFAAMAVMATVVRAVGSRYLAAPQEAPGATTAPSDLTQWACGLWDQTLASLLQAWEDQKAMLLMILIPATAVPLLVGLLRPRLARIVMTSLLGAAAIVAGALAINEDWWNGVMAQGRIVGGAVALLMLVGLIVQYRRAFAGDRKKDNAPEAEPEEDGHLVQRAKTVEEEKEGEKEEEKGEKSSKQGDADWQDEEKEGKTDE